MKLKCPVCNSCLTFTYVGHRRFFWCDFCSKIYDEVDGNYRLVRGIQVTEEGLVVHYEDTPDGL